MESKQVESKHQNKKRKKRKRRVKQDVKQKHKTSISEDVFRLNENPENEGMRNSLKSNLKAFMRISNYKEYNDVIQNLNFSVFNAI